jgi:hypothetical protein
MQATCYGPLRQLQLYSPAATLTASITCNVVSNYNRHLTADDQIDRRPGHESDEREGEQYAEHLAPLALGEFARRLRPTPVKLS